MRKYILIAFLMTTLFSCSDEFLTEKAVTTLTSDYYKTPAGLEILTKGSYQILRFKPDYNQGNYLFGIGSDVEVYCWSLPERIEMGGYNISGWSPTATGTRVAPHVNSLIGSASGGVSEGVYPTIGRCNIFMENFAKLDAAGQAALAPRKGEMLFLRAYSYFLITNILGDAPIIKESFDGMPANFNFKKEKMEEIYKVMISDLVQASNLLPATTSDLGRITQPAANHFLAKLYLVRAQGAQFQNSTEPTLKALFKGAVTTDLDSAIIYSTKAITAVAPTNAAYGGLTPNFATLFTTTADYARDTQKEILLSAQYEPTQMFDGRYGNTLVHLFNSNHTTLTAATPRTLDYGRPYATAGASDWGYDMYTDRANDSRYYKTYLTDYVATYAGTNWASSGSKVWDAKNAAYYNAYLKTSDKPAAAVGKLMIAAKGDRSIVYIENSKDQPLDSLWVVSQPFVMMVRWIACSPNGTGYFNADKTLKTSAMADPANPVVTNTAGRKLAYRLSGDKGDLFGLDRGTGVAQWYMGPRKWLDPFRGKSSDPNGAGSIDIPLFRLAETYLIRAEAYGRKGLMTEAIADINVLRKRAAYHAGEKRSDVLVKMEPAVLTGKLTIPAGEKASPYLVSTDSYNQIKVDGTEWVAGSAKAKLENYCPNAANLFVEFIYNERARELIFELTNVEDLHNAGLLYDRIYYHDMLGAPATSTGTADFPFPLDDFSKTNGALGKGKGTLDRKYTFKPWPQSFLDLLTDENNHALTTEAKAAYQNFGY